MLYILLYILFKGKGHGSRLLYYDYLCYDLQNSLNLRGGQSACDKQTRPYIPWACNIILLHVTFVTLLVTQDRAIRCIGWSSTLGPHTCKMQL